MAKLTPWMRVSCYPLGETSVITRAGFVRTDLLRRLSRGAGQAPPEYRLPDLSVGGVRLTTPQSALETGAIIDEENLRWWELVDPQEGTDVAGFTVAPYILPRSNRMSDAHMWEVVGRRDPLPLTWVSLSGGGFTSENWGTFQPDAEPQTEAIGWRGTARGEQYMAETALSLPANQCWAMRLWFLGTAPIYRDAEPAQIETPGGTYTVDFSEEVTPSWHVQWAGGTWAVDFRLGAAPALCRLVNGEWLRARVFRDFDTDLFASGEPMWLRCYAIAGRLVLEIETAGGQTSRVVYTETVPDQYGQRQATPVKLPRGRARITGRGVAFTAQMHEVRFGRWVEATTDEWGVTIPAHFDGEGSFAREYNCNRVVSANDLTTTAFGYYPDGSPYRKAEMYEGDASNVATVTDAPIRDVRGRTTGRRRYECTLSAHNGELTREHIDDREEAGEGDAMVGARTPFVYGVAVKVGSSRTATSTDPIDIRPALSRVTESLADPQISAGPMWNFQINRNLLGESIHQGTGNPIGNDWPDYVAKNHRVDADVSWTHEDGTVSAGASPHDAANAPFVRRLMGFLMGEGPESSGFGDYRGTLTARDFSVLLQAPAGIIDGRFAPLDLSMHEKLADGDRTLMGWEAVQDILEKALGPDIAGALVHKFPAGHYDLLTHRLMLDPPHGGFSFPPPYGSDARRWIEELAQRDHALFFWAAEWGKPTTVAPHYCNYYEYLDAAPEVEVQDAEYLAGATDNLITSAGWSHDPAQDINRVLVQGAPPGAGSLGGLMPSMNAFSAEARIDTGSPIAEQNIEDTWERTKLLGGSQYWLKGVARVVAINLLRMVRGVDMRGIDITVRGNPYLWWGWKVTPRMNAAASDPHGLRLHNQLCRIIRVSNVIDFERGRYDTALRVAPEPNLEG